MGTTTSVQQGLKWFGLGGFTLNFIIESGTFNNFLHEEANQLVIKTLKCARKHLPCYKFEPLCERAKQYVTDPAYDQFQQWYWTNPFTENTFAWIFWQSKYQMREIEQKCKKSGGL